MKSVALALSKGIDNVHDRIQLGDVPEDQIPRLEVLKTGSNIDIDAAGLGRLRPGRTQRLAQTSPHSFWVHPQDNKIAYFVVGGVLKKLETTYNATVIATLSTNDECCFDVINSLVVVSNGTNIGWLEGTAYTAFSQTVGQFEAAMPAGQFIAWDYQDNCLLVAKDNVVYKSKPYNCMVRDIRYSKFPMDGYIRMLGTVEDGWWVGTDKHVGFVGPDEQDGHKFTFRSDFVPPIGCFGHGFVRGTEKPERVVYWASNGFYEGKASGVLVNRSEPLARLPGGITGHCFRREHRGWYQYVAVIRNHTDGNIYAVDSMKQYQGLFDIDHDISLPNITLSADG